MLLILKNERGVSKKTNLFIEKVSKHLLKRKIKFFVASLEDIEIFIESGRVTALIKNKPLDQWSTLFIREVGDKVNLVFILARLSNKSNIAFIDRFRENTCSITKLVQMFLLATNNIPIPKTYYAPIYGIKEMRNAVNYLGFPIIIKRCNTSHGEGVSLAKNFTELGKKLKNIQQIKQTKEIILQEFIENDFEYRLLVTGTTIAVGEKKIRTSKNEFRNNVHLGAREEFLDLSCIQKRIKKIATSAARIVNVQLAGVDVVVGKNGTIAVFEVNSCPGFTYNEKISDELSKVADYLSSCERRK